MRFRTKMLAALVLVPLVVVAASTLVMYLWNWVVPDLIVGARSIDLLHAVGLLVLARLLFGGWRGHGGWHARRHWRRWEAMTPEEREQFSQMVGQRHGHCHGGRRHRGRDEGGAAPGHGPSAGDGPAAAGEPPAGAAAV